MLMTLLNILLCGPLYDFKHTFKAYKNVFLFENFFIIRLLLQVLSSVFLKGAQIRQTACDNVQVLQKNASTFHALLVLML